MNADPSTANFGAVLTNVSQMTVLLQMAEWLVVFAVACLFLVNMALLVRSRMTERCVRASTICKVISRQLLLLLVALWIVEFTRCTHYQFLTMATQMEQHASPALIAVMHHYALLPMLASAFVLFGTVLQGVVEVLSVFRNAGNKG